MTTTERNKLYCGPIFRNQVISLLMGWRSEAPLTTNERGLIAEAYNSEPQVEPATIAKTILDARRAPLAAAAAQARATRRAA